MTVLFFVGTIILFLGIDWFVRRLRAREPQADTGGKIIDTYPMRMPDGVFFTKSHTWLNLFPSGKLLLGVDDFVGRLLDKPQINHLKRAGDTVRKGDPLLELKVGNRSLTIQSPIDGEILETNDELPERPDLLRENLFNEGWSYLIKPVELAQIKEFFIGTESRSWIHQEFRHLRDFFSGTGNTGVTSPAFLQDGGPPVSGILGKMDDHHWSQFEQEFLQIK